MRCKACDLPPADRLQVDRALRSGESEYAIGSRFGISRASIHRHREAHLTEVLPPESQDSQAEIENELKTLQRVCRAVLARAMESEQDKTALLAVREASRLLKQAVELHGRVSKMKVTFTVDLRTSAAFSELSAVASQALRDFPEARAALSVALTQSRKG